MKENPIWKPVLYVRIHIQGFNPATAELNLPHLQPKNLVMITLEFSQEITSHPSFNLSCSLFQSNGHVNGDCDLQQHGIPKRKIWKLSRICLPKKKSKSIQIDLPKGH